MDPADETTHANLCKIAVAQLGESEKRAGTSLRACLCTQDIHKKAGPLSAARPKMDLPFPNRLACNRQVPALLRKMAMSPLAGAALAHREECNRVALNLSATARKGSVCAGQRQCLSRKRQWKHTQRQCCSRGGGGTHKVEAVSWPRRQWKHTAKAVSSPRRS